MVSENLHHKSSLNIGVLGLQGAVEEHIKKIQELGYHGTIIKKPDQLEQIDGLILPGGESTTLRKLMDSYGFFQPLLEFSANKKPIFGTCAGMVLLAKKLEGSEEAYLKLMDIRVKRNAFGRQRESFEVTLPIQGFTSDFPAVFIRAPYIESVGNQVEVLSTYKGHIVAAKQEQILVTAFHPELTEDPRFFQLFIQMIKK